MAYLHCHACGWEQDDFWEWKWWDGWQRPFGYNPLSLMMGLQMNGMLGGGLEGADAGLGSEELLEGVLETEVVE